MKHRFVMVSNVMRLRDAIARLERRGAREKQIVVVAGPAGLGKSHTADWWTAQNGAVAITCKPTATPAWVLRDLLAEVNVAPKRSTADLFDQAVRELAPDPRPIVVDEVENAMGDDARALDTLRSLVDLIEVPLVLVGREGTREKLQRQPQLWSRIGGVAEFQPLSLADVRLVCDELVEGRVADEVVAEIHGQSKGLAREVLQAAAEVDAVARRKPERETTLADLDGRPLCGVWRRAPAARKGAAKPAASVVRIEPAKEASA